MVKGTILPKPTHCRNGHPLTPSNVYLCTCKSNGRQYKKCRKCTLARFKIYKRLKTAFSTPKHREENQKKWMNWSRGHPRWNSTCGILKKFNLTIDEYHSMQERQDFVCYLCGSEGVLCVDHNHSTLEIRKLLCRACNTGIAKFKESPLLLRAAADYCEGSAKC